MGEETPPFNIESKLMNSVQTKPMHSVFMQIISSEEIGNLKNAVRNTEFLLAELGESEDGKPLDPSNLIFIVTDMSFDEHGNLMGRVTPTGPHKDKGREWISTKKYKTPIFKFIPRVATNNRNWTFINKLDVVVK